MSKKPEAKKSEGMTTINISIENHAKLNTYAKLFQKILKKKKVTADQVISVLTSVKDLGVQLQEIIMEDSKEYMWTKKEKSQQEGKNHDETE